MSSWAELAGPERGADYAARFAALAAAGADVHGEATFCATLAESGARILDAGCGTGRVAIRLAELGFDCVGVDVDEAMLAQARAAAPALTWVRSDLAALPELGSFRLVVAAGNVIPLLDRGTEATVVANLAARLVDGGTLVAGFGLDAAHLPLSSAPVTLADYEGWCAAAGLRLVGRFATWAGAPFDDGGYAVSVHTRSRPTGSSGGYEAPPAK
ncbi:class I SAM-dependent methyltransferase [Jatrophihabitans sp.]|uniref:class I SAM-dependent methyltransferase n=1 Tax=Jatrophihabitans sp. TaxID=1932789 RepID=UPI0030C7025B|nr:SAM-dependent methyltransferase [Jatrophihabitans sp.]